MSRPRGTRGCHTDPLPHLQRAEYHHMLTEREAAVGEHIVCHCVCAGYDT